MIRNKINTLFVEKQKAVSELNSQAFSKWIWKKLSEIAAGSTILDAGAGELKNKRYCKHLIYTSQDICEYDGRGDRKGLQTAIWDTDKVDIISDIKCMPINSDSFDAVLCSQVLEHVYEPEKAVKEMIRVLKPGGVLLITAPFCSLTHFAPYHYSTGFNIYWYRKVAGDNNAKIVEMKRIGNFFDFLRQEIFRIPNMKCMCGNEKIGMFDKILLLLLNERLKYYGKKRGGRTAEILCFGYCIKMQKSFQ